MTKHASYLIEGPDGRKIPVDLHVPEVGNDRVPVIIFLHGIGERGNGSSELWKVKRIAIPNYIANGNKMRFQKDGKWHSFIVLSPQCAMKYSMWPTLYVDAMIEYAEKNLRIDKNRI